MSTQQAGGNIPAIMPMQSLVWRYRCITKHTNNTSTGVSLPKR